MPAPRIPPLDHPTERVATMLRRMMPAGHEPLALFRTLAHNAGFLDAFRRFGAYLLYFGELAPADREVIIHRMTALCGADYEWAVHAFYFGGTVGLDARTLRATRRIDAPGPERAERLDRRTILLI